MTDPFTHPQIHTKNSSDQHPVRGAVVLCLGVCLLVLAISASSLSRSGITRLDHIPQAESLFEIYAPPPWYRIVERNLLPDRFRGECPRFHRTGGIVVQGDITRRDHLEDLGHADAVKMLVIDDCQHPEMILESLHPSRTLEIANCHLDERFFQILNQKPVGVLKMHNCEIDVDPAIFSAAVNQSGTVSIWEMPIDAELCRLLASTSEIGILGIHDCVVSDDFLAEGTENLSRSGTRLYLYRVIITDSTLERLIKKLGPPTQGSEDRKKPAHQPRSFSFLRKP